MSAVSLILKSVAEIAVILFLIWGFINENKLVRFEKKIFKLIKKISAKRRAAREAELERELLDSRYEEEYETERRSAPKIPAKPSEKTGHKRKSQKSRVA